jgi:hypothetical protein
MEVLMTNYEFVLFVSLASYRFPDPELVEQAELFGVYDLGEETQVMLATTSADEVDDFMDWWRDGGLNKSLREWDGLAELAPESSRTVYFYDLRHGGKGPQFFRFLGTYEELKLVFRNGR